MLYFCVENITSSYFLSVQCIIFNWLFYFFYNFKFDIIFQNSIFLFIWMKNPHSLFMWASKNI